MCALTASRYVSPFRVDEAPTVISERFHVLTSKFLRQFGILLVNRHINIVTMVNTYTDTVNCGSYQRICLVARNTKMSCTTSNCKAAYTLHHFVESLLAIA